jgi:chemotaxis protein methyltransferase CheR
MKRSLESIELDLIVEGIYEEYGHDFRNYTKASLRRRFLRMAQDTGHRNIGELIPAVLRDRGLWERVLAHIPVTVTEFFRDPVSFRVLREEVFPVLRTYPLLRIWSAGCATGEEVVSLAILLQEAGLLERTRLFGTDLSRSSIQYARRGVYELADLEESQERYRDAGGTGELLDYFMTGNENAKLKNSLLKQITFANHNLVLDASFGEVHLVVCQNVFIYFNRTLQEHVLDLFADSLVRGGWLLLGEKERVDLDSKQEPFTKVEVEAMLYRLDRRGA